MLPHSCRLRKTNLHFRVNYAIVSTGNGKLFIVIQEHSYHITQQWQDWIMCHILSYKETKRPKKKIIFPYQL